MKPNTKTKPAQLNDELHQLTEQEIREASRSWSTQEWEQYLRSLEVGLKESQPTLHEISHSALEANIFDVLGPSCSEETSQLIEKLVAELSEKKRFVIEKYFFEGRSNSEIAEMMGVSRQRVFTLKKKALRQLKYIAKQVVGSFPIVGAQDSENQKMVREIRPKGELSC